MEFYAVIKKNEIISFVRKRKQLETIMLSKKKKDTER